MDADGVGTSDEALQVALTDHHDSPFDNVAHREVQLRVDAELRRVPEPYRTALVLRDLEDMSYEEIAEILQISLGTVKSRLTRGRQALKKRLAPYVREVGDELGLTLPDLAPPNKDQENHNAALPRRQVAGGGRRVEVTP